MQVPASRNLHTRDEGQDRASWASPEPAYNTVCCGRHFGWWSARRVGWGCAVKVTVTPIGAPSDGVGAAAGAYVDYLAENHKPPVGAGGLDGAVGYYAANRGESLVEGPGQWRGHGADRLELAGSVASEDLAALLAGRNPSTGVRLTSARGSAGRISLKVGSHTRMINGRPAWSLADATAALGDADIGGLVDEVPEEYVLVAGAKKYLSRKALRFVESRLTDQREIERVAFSEAFMSADPGDWVSANDVARVAGVTGRYVRQCLEGEDSPFPTCQQTARGEWMLNRGEAIAFIEARTAPNVRVAFDCTTTLEKSVSILGLVANDAAVRSVVAEIVAESNAVAMDWLDRNASAGRKRNASIGSEGLTIASFMHGTSRNDDPFLHVHNVVVNAIEDAEGRGRTLDSTALYSEAKAAGARATAHLRVRLSEELGVEWRKSASGVWEVDGISDLVLRHFSTRTKEIEEALAELRRHGQRSPDQDHVKKATRKPKSGVHPDDARRGWQQQAAELGFDAADLSAIRDRRRESRAVNRSKLFGWLESPEGVCSNGPTFTYGDLLAAIADWAPAGGQLPVLSVDQIEAHADAWLLSHRVHQVVDQQSQVSKKGKPLGRQSRDVWTTETMRRLQSDIRTKWLQGLQTDRGVADPEAISSAITEAEFTLSDEQQALVWAWLTSGDAVQAAVGRPGTGKTTTMAAAVQAWRGSGFSVFGAAVKGEAARKLAAETGLESNTVASYITKWASTGLNPLDGRSVLIVDESSTLSDWELHTLIEMAADAGAAVRLIGDVAQHGSVETGGSWGAMATELGGQTPELRHQRRVINPAEIEAAEMVRNGEIAAALDTLAEGGTVHEYQRWSDAFGPLAQRWFDQRDQGRPHPIVERRNEIRAVLNTIVQQVRAHEGEIGGLVAVGERTYGVGDQIVARAPNKQLHPDGEPGLYVRNGVGGTITAIEDHQIVVDFDDLGSVAVPTGWAGGNTDLSYAVTSYAVQGATFDASTSALGHGASQAELLVNITRGRQENAVMVIGAGDEELSALSEQGQKPLAAGVAESIRYSSSPTLHEIDDAVAKTQSLAGAAGTLDLARLRNLDHGANPALIQRARMERLAQIRVATRSNPPADFVSYYGPAPTTPWLHRNWQNAAADLVAYREEWGRRRSNDGTKWSWLVGPASNPTQHEAREQLLATLESLFVDVNTRKLDSQSINPEALRQLAGRPPRQMEAGTERELSRDDSLAQGAAL